MTPNNSLSAVLWGWIAYWPVLLGFPLLAIGAQAVLNSFVQPAYTASAEVQASDADISSFFLDRLVPDVRSQVLNEWTLSFSAEGPSADHARERVEKALATVYNTPLVMGAERVARIMQIERIDAAAKLLEDIPGTHDALEMLRIEASDFSERLDMKVSIQPTAPITVSASRSNVNNIMGAGLSALFLGILVVSILRYRANWSEVRRRETARV